MWIKIKDALYGATHRVVVGVANFSCPRCWPWCWRSCCRRWWAGCWRPVGVILARADCDKRLQKWGFVVLAEWSPKNSPTLLLRKTVTWTRGGVGLVGSG